MPRENRDSKARRFLVEGRLTVERVGAGNGMIVASCKGDSGEVYQLGYDARRREWRCTCEASRVFHRRCSHLTALQLVVVKP